MWLCEQIRVGVPLKKRYWHVNCQSEPSEGLLVAQRDLRKSSGTCALPPRAPSNIAPKSLGLGTYDLIMFPSV